MVNQINVQRTLVYITLAFLMSILHGCGNEKSKLKSCSFNVLEQGTKEFDPSELASLVCDMKPRYIRASLGTHWQTMEGEKVVIASNGDLVTYDALNSKARNEIEKFHSLILRDSVSRRNFNKILSEGLIGDDFTVSEYKFLRVVRLLGDTNNSLDIVFFGDNDKPKWIVLCVNYCNYSDPKIIKVISK